jgi:choline dehydrogenase-like flavoprotein
MEVEAVLIGAGVVGLAAARRLAELGREVVVPEQEKTIGTHGSSRNSEVIHAGMYYPQGSLMARLCVAGRKQLYRYCAPYNVPARAFGKLIVATTAAPRRVTRRCSRNCPTYISPTHEQITLVEDNLSRHTAPRSTRPSPPPNRSAKRASTRLPSIPEARVPPSLPPDRRSATKAKHGLQESSPSSPARGG